MDFKEIESKFQPTEDSKCAESENGMVATAFPDATLAGVEMLNKAGRKRSGCSLCCCFSS